MHSVSVLMAQSKPYFDLRLTISNLTKASAIHLKLRAQGRRRCIENVSGMEEVLAETTSGFLLMLVINSSPEETKSQAACVTHRAELC